MSDVEAPAAEGSAEAQYVKAKTSVWWDIENCPAPRVYDPYSIALNINSALSKLNYCGPVSISAYGDTNRIPKDVQQALSSTGISVHHVPAGVKDKSDKKILVDMLFWAVDNPAPANYLLISGDRDFSNALHQLRMRRYSILLAQPAQTSVVELVSAAKTVWQWTNLLIGGGPIAKGESTELVNGGNHINQEASQNHISEPLHMYQPAAVSHPDSYAVGNRKFMSPGKAGAGDPKYKGKHVNKKLNQPSLTKSQSVPMVGQESKNNGYNPQLEYAQGRGPGHAIPAGWSVPNNFQGNADPSANNAKNFIGMQENQYPYPPGPRGFANSAPGNMIRANPAISIQVNPPIASMPIVGQESTNNEYNPQLQYAQGCSGYFNESMYPEVKQLMAHYGFSSLEQLIIAAYNTPATLDEFVKKPEAMSNSGQQNQQLSGVKRPASSTQYDKSKRARAKSMQFGTTLKPGKICNGSACCYNCGGSSHRRQKCTKKPRVCRGCGREGHMLKYCRTKNSTVSTGICS